MNTKHLLLAATAAFVALNFIGCKEKDDFDYTFENCAYFWGIHIESSYTDGRMEYYQIFNAETVIVHGNRVKIYQDVQRKTKLDDVETGSIISLGTSKNDMTIIPDDELIPIKPFMVYYIESIPFIVHNSDTSFAEKQFYKFYSIPNHKLDLTADYGDGEIAANIHWQIKYSYDGLGISHTEFLNINYNGPITAIKVSMTTDVDTSYNKNVIDFPVNIDSCYITPGGTREKPDFPAYINKYWKDGKTIMRYEPIIYNVNVTATVPVGDTSINVSNNIKTILMDRQQCVCDNDFNIYRIAKFGNKVWTIDDCIINSSERGVKSDFYGGNNYFYDVDYSYEVPGYHMATKEDWNELFDYFEMERPSTSIGLRDGYMEKLLAKDTSMQKYFSNKGNWEYLLSQYGWSDSEKIYSNVADGLFNAVPAGVYNIETHKIEGEYEFASLYCRGGSLIISRHYQGVALISNIRGSTRLVKD